jgi:uncharacterized Zn finger protein
MWGYGDFPRYVSVKDRRKQAARKIAELKKQGRTVSPVVIEGRAIAKTFWGKAWCENLEAYSDYASRLPRGRTYARNGSVIDLRISPGKVAALVSGSDIYEVEGTIQSLPKARWKAVVKECAGQIDSVVELLAGQLSRGVMEILCRKGTGLFPSSKEIDLDCSCPDGAYLCKHLAAVLYGVGARLDQEPELLFVLRGVDKMELIGEAERGGSIVGAAEATHVLADESLADVFGIDLEPVAPPAPRKRRGRKREGP